MTQLSNVNLLDDNIGQNLKTERLQKTSMIADNPNSDILQNNVTKKETIQMQIPQMEERKNNTETQINNNDDEQIPNNLPIRDYGKKQVAKDVDDKKILGMKPAMFYTLLGVAVIVGGYFAYKKFGKKGKGSTSSSGSSSSSSSTKIETPPLGEVPIT